MTGSTPAVRTVGLTKRYGSVTALDSVDVSIDENRYFVLLGPSGGGKTTLLRLIGGFLRASAGRVFLHGTDMTEQPPERRPTSMVFQSYALFPHMNVEKNVGYGLRLRKQTRAEMSRRVDRMLELVGLTGLNARMPHELSGGQQQRVQLARSLVLERDVLLLDEPLAALDATLRKDMCLELKRIQEEVGITFVHVTHNQEEAMTVADRVAIICDGTLVEEGTPRDVYERPRRRFTAEFIGENNLFDAGVLESDGTTARLELGFAQVLARCGGHALEAGQRVTLSIRSELLDLRAGPARDGGDRQWLPATVVKSVYLGLTSSCLVRLRGGRDVIVRHLSHGGALDAPPGTSVEIGWRMAHARLHVD